MNLTAYDLASRFTGIKEIAGVQDNPQLMAMLKLDDEWPQNDEVPWCSAFVNYVAWLMRLPRSKSLRARSWLQVGQPIRTNELNIGFDIVILNRSDGPMDPQVIDAPGHVGFFMEWERTTTYRVKNDGKMLILGGNQNNTVCARWYDSNRVLGCRRLHSEGYDQ